MKFFLPVVLGLWMGPALADLYRWVDPETGSVKFSSYPPPWYGDEKAEKRAPKVEHIPPRGPGGSPRAEPQSPREGEKRPAEPVGKPAASAGAPRSP